MGDRRSNPPGERLGCPRYTVSTSGRYWGVRNGGVVSGAPQHLPRLKRVQLEREGRGGAPLA